LITFRTIFLFSPQTLIIDSPENKMCGIYGLIRRYNTIDLKHLTRQRDLLKHRGPSDSGTWVSSDGRIGLAHRRLSILDLTAAGHQPMTSQDGRFVIVFNGEIYNHHELRQELRELGHVFYTGADTEVLLCAYIAWGEEFLVRLNGMFAFSIHDRGTAHVPPTLFMARDRAGKKPLYYFLDKNHLEFASELKAIYHRTGISLSALNFYLALGYVPGDHCILEGVKKLPPAHAAKLDLSTFDFRVWRYWSLPPNRPEQGVDGESLADEAGKLIEDATRLRLQADVPVGVLLSGGLDSSLIVAAAAHVSSAPVRTFTVSLPGSPLDESVHAKQVSHHFGTEHHEIALENSGLDVLDEIAQFIDEPIADSSLIPTFLVSKLTRQHVTVALGGDGGDELFGGYKDYSTSLVDQYRFGWLPQSALSIAATASSFLPAGIRGRNRIASMKCGPLQQMIWGRPYFDKALRQRILSRDACAELGQELDAPERFLLGLYDTGFDPIDRMTRTHFGSILPDDFLVKVDRMSMAVSLEMRAPLLDYRLVEFAFGRIPSEWKVNGGDTRRVQKILASKWLPSELDIKRKQGFSIPFEEWLRGLGEKKLRQYFTSLPESINHIELENLIKGLGRGRTNGARLFALMMLNFSVTNLLSS
jgi:asparagine synthase (glutamine-hydrolysing)